MKKQDPANYRELSKPIPKASADAVLEAFFEELTALRQKHRIADVLTIVQINIEYQSGEGVGSSFQHCGSSINALPMVAQVYGELKKAHAETMSKLISGK